MQLDARDLTPLNVLGPGPGGEKGAGGTGTPAGFTGRPASTAPARTTNLLVQDLVIDTPGRHVIRARTGDGATLESVVQVDAWMQPRAGARPARNIILLLGDGMGSGVRTAARVVSKGQHFGKSAAPLAMDTMPVTGLSVTSVAECDDHRLGAGHVGAVDRPQGQQQPGGRLPRQHARRLRQPARRVHRRAAPPHPRAPASTSAS